MQGDTLLDVKMRRPEKFTWNASHCHIEYSTVLENKDGHRRIKEAP
jgi:hypothetical protein